MLNGGVVALVVVLCCHNFVLLIVVVGAGDGAAADNVCDNIHKWGFSIVHSATAATADSGSCGSSSIG